MHPRTHITIDCIAIQVYRCVCVHRGSPRSLDIPRTGHLPTLSWFLASLFIVDPQTKTAEHSQPGDLRLLAAKWGQ